MVTEPRLSREGVVAVSVWPSIVIVMLCAIGLDSTGAAGGGWVLWKQNFSKKDRREQHTIVGTYSTKQVCDLALQNERQLVSPFPITEWICLPDTVDPRAPKAK
jgi:hypothetical protein